MFSNLNFRKIISQPNTSLLLILVFINTIIFIGIFILHISNIILFFFSGLLSGLFYAIADHRIFDFPYEDEFEIIRLNEEYKNEHFRRTYFLTDAALLHKFILHLVCGMIAGVCLYSLLSDQSIQKILNGCNDQLDKLKWAHLTLFFISILGYLGYLPRTFWFFAQKGGPAK